MEQRLQLSDSCRGKGGNDAVHVGLNVLTLQARRSHKESFNASFCKQVRSWARMMKGKKNIKEYQKKLRQDLTVFRIFQVSQWNKQLSIQIFTFFFLKVLVSPYSYFKLICCIFVFIQFNKFSLSLFFFFWPHSRQDLVPLSRMESMSPTAEGLVSATGLGLVLDSASLKLSVSHSTSISFRKN